MQGTLFVLMWKHLVVRTRRYINTIFELAAPILLFIILFSFKNYIISPKSHLDDQYNVQQLDPVKLDSVQNPTMIYYSPENNFNKLLMQDVKEYLDSHPSKSFYSSSVEVLPLKNNTNISELSEDSAAIILFKDDVKEMKPKMLRYTIRMKKAFSTYSYESMYMGVASHWIFGTVYEGFMKLQWAIDSNYLKLLTGKEIEQQVTLQELPFKRVSQRQEITIICLVLNAFCMLGLMVVFVMVMVRLTEERINGIQELIKMVGVSNNMLALSNVLNTLPTGLLFSILPSILLTVTSLPILCETNGFLIFVMLLLYFISVLGMAFACSYIPSNTQYTTTIAIFAFIALCVPENIIDRELPPWSLPLVALLPHVPLKWFWTQVRDLETYSFGINFGNMAVKHSHNTLPVLYCYFALIVQSIIFFALSWYLSQVRPGPYGQALQWSFLCQPRYWSKSKVTPDLEEELEELEEDQDPEYFEPPHKSIEVGIKIVNINKMFGQQRVLNNVTLDVYKGEITVLLGHNGAGKTTLMSIITGMYSATEGNVYVEGLDTVKQKDEMRRHLGLCPQHNLFFSDLTVLEHVTFFTMLKGLSWKEATVSSIELLEKLGLSSKLNDKSDQLSGGMKRRLQLACALAGDARVLVLDEPTSGLDVETRRELWDLLLSLRGSRTVLLSTHFMEEAEALGDRVAALHAGRLRCSATPMHLKRTLGTGYRLSFTTDGMPNERAITALITSKIPEATVKEVSLNSITYNLPSKSSNKFPTLFNTLESKRYDLGIHTIGVGLSTLEEVFLKLCSDVTTTFSDDTVDGEFIEPTFKSLFGVPLYAHQLLVLLTRQFKYMWSKKISFLILQVVGPILCIVLFTIMSNNTFSMGDDSWTEKNIALDLNLYDRMDDPKVLYNIDSDQKVNMKKIENKYPQIVFEKTDNISDAVLRTELKNVMEYNKYLVGIELKGTDAKVFFTTVVRHAAPVALNLLTNILAAQHTDGQITTYNHPVTMDNVYYDTQNLDLPKDPMNTFVWIGLIILIVLSTTNNAASLPCKEHAAGVRHVHIMTGCPPALHWAASIIAYFTLYLLVLVIPSILAPIIFEKDNTINQPDFLGTLFVILTLGILAFLAFTYIITFYFKEQGTSSLLIGILMVFGLLTPILGHKSEVTGEQPKSFEDYLIDLISYTIPPHTTMIAGLNAVKVLRYNQSHEKMPQKCYFCFDNNAPGLYMLLLFVQYIVYMSLVILTEYGLFNSLCDHIFNMRYNPSTPVDADDMVRAEKAYVDKAITLPPNQIQDTMLVNDIHKNYWRIFRKSCNAVKGVSFSIKKGECFGLLGVNGAGKSTTFKMLTATESPTRGSIFANGYFMNKLSGNYLRSLGYCPQFLGLDAFLTGHDNLALLLTLRGLAPHDVQAETKSWIETVGLEKYASRPASTYSGGCSRRLAAAAALCRGAAVTLLDEPTVGVDVAARRRVWAAVRRAKPNRAVVITSHSMDEMEALCGRIAIMSLGRVRALGEAAELRATHGAGHAVLLKLATTGQTTTDELDGAKPDLNRLKAALHEKFNCTLKDEHKTRLRYHINDTVRYSDLFSALEALKEEFAHLLEDYSVTETTLEEVFLSFAKEEPRDGPTPV